MAKGYKGSILAALGIGLVICTTFTRSIPVERHICLEAHLSDAESASSTNSPLAEHWVTILPNKQRHTLLEDSENQPLVFGCIINRQYHVFNGSENVVCIHYKINGRRYVHRLEPADGYKKMTDIPDGVQIDSYAEVAPQPYSPAEIDFVEGR